MSCYENLLVEHTPITKNQYLLPEKGTVHTKGATRVSVDFQVKVSRKLLIVFGFLLLVNTFVIENLTKLCNFILTIWAFYA